MARVSISIPNKLMTRLEPIKDEINISQLCHEAIEQRVAAFERASNGDGNALDLDSLVQRLRQERELFESNSEQLGKDNAAAWMSSASYPEVKAVTDYQGPANMRSYRLPRAAFKGTKHDMEKAQLDCEGPHIAAYKTAWLDYVKTVWAQVVDRVEPAGRNEAVETAAQNGA